MQAFTPPAYLWINEYGVELFLGGECKHTITLCVSSLFPAYCISSNQTTLMLQRFLFFFSFPPISTAAERAAGCHSSLGSDWPQPTVRMPALQPVLWNITQGICGSSAACEWSCGSLWNSPLLCPLGACYAAERCLFLKWGLGQKRACMDLWWTDAWTYDLWQ